MARGIQRSAASGLLAGFITAGAVLIGVQDLSARTLLLALTVGTCISAAFAWRYWKKVAIPEAMLRETVEAIAAGNVERPLPPKDWGELRRLANAIEELRTGFQERISQAQGEEAQLRAVLADMVEGVLVLDESGCVLVANQRLRELADAWEEIRGRPHWEVFRRGPLADALAEAAESDQIFVKEINIEAADSRVLEMHATPFARGGSRLGTVAVFHDITELRRLERVRSDFVANVSHELKTPLTAIRGFAETLRIEEVGDEQRERYLGVIERHARRLTRLIEDLLALSRVEGRTAKVEPEAIELSRAVGSVLTDMASQIESRKLEVTQDHSGDTRVWADRLAVEQVLVNLIDNASKYTDPGGRIEVRTEPCPKGVRLTVSDSGIGISEKQKDRIFERFYRVDEARGRDVGGTGLGLAIVKHLVQLSEGEIFVESKLGEGTSFIVTFPAPPRS